MNFLNSTILAGLVAAFAPLIIHLLNRQKVRTVQFSSLRFLRDLQKTKMRRLKLRQALLLIIRTLIVVFLVLAFARPTIKGDAFSALGAHADDGGDSDGPFSQHAGPHCRRLSGGARVPQGGPGDHALPRGRSGGARDI